MGIMKSNTVTKGHVMKVATETAKPRGRTPAKLNITEAPDVGCAYIGMTKNEKNNPIIVRIGTTCARDTNESKKGELVGAQLTNYSGVIGKGKGEKYFTAKLGRKGQFSYLIFMCSAHHPKCMGAEVKPSDLRRDHIENTISRLIKGAESGGAKTDKEDRLVISGFQGDFKFEWINQTYKSALAEGIAIYDTKGGAYLQKAEKVAMAAKTVKETKPAKKPAKPVKPVKKEKPAKKPAKPVKPVKKEKPAKKPVKAHVAEIAPDIAPEKTVKKDTRSTFFGITDGKGVTKRSASKPEGYYDSKEERDAALAAAVPLKEALSVLTSTLLS